MATTKPSKTAPKKAKLFQSGNSQAVRLPKEFRLPGKTVTIKKHGKGLLIQPEEVPEDHPWKNLFAVYGSIPDFMAEGRDQGEFEKRAWDFDE